MLIEHARIRDGSSKLARVKVTLPADAWHGHASETMWAEPLEGDRYRIRSIPFYVTGLSSEDVVGVRPDDPIPIVEKIIVRGGHSTYRVFLADELERHDEKFKELWQPLEQLGCHYERATKRLFAIDVPRSSDIQAAYALLEKGAAQGDWDFEEGYFAS